MVSEFMCRDLVVMEWAGGLIIIDLKHYIILYFMKINLTAVFKLALKGRRTLKDSSHQKIKAIGDKEDSHIVVSYKYS